MDPKKVHHIRQQLIYADIKGTESEGKALQHLLKSLCNSQLRSVMEDVFNRYSPNSGELYFEHLYLDIGTVSSDQLENNFSVLVGNALEQSICDQIKKDGNYTGSDQDTIENVRQISSNRMVWEVLFYFLETGRLPWSIELQTGSTLETVLQKQAFNILDIESLRLVLFNSNARKRLVNQFSPLFLDDLLESISFNGKRNFDLVISKLNSSTRLPKEDLPLYKKQLRLLLFEEFAKAQVFSEDELLKQFIHDLWQSEVQLSKKILKENLNEVVKSLWPKVHADLISKEGNGGLELFKKNDFKKNLHLLDEQSLKLNLSRERKQSLLLEKKEGFYINNAGLVLLHPFLSMIFETLKISKENKLLEPERALCLLYFLTTGRNSPAEYELVLPKILCNMELDKPVESIQPLSQADQDEAENLLKAVIGHWDALRDTSPDALRGTFLYRPGKISRRNDNGWLLQVEHQSFDILLEGLPWGIGMIKLPWMQEMLFVEWN
ncbi:MAG TPA: contractile injection system tape measure protein [Saprospiraceae bacterium]|nr:contractile injection system tape measure protein [Saprospiraceae bacterium]